MKSRIEIHGTIAHQNISVDGVTRTLKEWSVFYGIPYATVRMRWKRGHRDPHLLFFVPFYKAAPIDDTD